MPLTRYQIRNEYSLADPELYRAADKDDPEALLEGVAMAGLVGVLRQLGDLAEFAAEIFHDLHEEVMATAARGHGLMVRVQQLEAEVPSVEKAFLSQTSHSTVFYDTGIDWHPNLPMNQNLITREDLPRFVMDSYEECRGPPRLFLLDKFDVGGAGACLKRYTDPSFFKVEASYAEMTNAEVHREKKIRKAKKKGSRWRNGETPDVLPTSNARLHQLFLEERVENGINGPARRVKLKRRLNGFPFDSRTGKSYMEKFLKSPSPEHKVVREISVSSSPLKLPSTVTAESGLEILEISTVSPGKESLLRKSTYSFSSPNLEETLLKPSMDELNEEVTDGITEMPNVNHYFGANNSLSTLNELVDEKEIAVDGENKAEGSRDGYKSDDIASEIDNYMDALTTMESEMETDTESKTKNDLGVLSIEKQGTDSDANEEQHDLQAEFSDSQSLGNCTGSDDGSSSAKKEISSFSFSDSLSNLAENTISDGAVSVKVSPSTEIREAETADISSDQHFDKDETPATELPVQVVSDDDCIEVAEIPIYSSEFGKSSSYLTDAIHTHSPIDTGASLREEYSLLRPKLDVISSDCNELVTGLINAEENGPCSSNLSDVPSQERDDSLTVASAENHPVDELDDEDPNVFSDASLHFSNILKPDPERRSENKLDDVPPIGYSEDGCTKNLVDGQIDSPHSVSSHNQEQPVHSILPELEIYDPDLQSDGIAFIVDEDAILSAGEIAVNKTPAVCSPQTRNYTEHLSETTYDVPPLELNCAEACTSYSGEKHLDSLNAPDPEEIELPIGGILTEAVQLEVVTLASAASVTEDAGNDNGHNAALPQKRLEVNEACLPENLKQSRTEEGDQQAVASPDLDSKQSNTVSHDHSNSELPNDVSVSSMAEDAENNLHHGDASTASLYSFGSGQYSESKPPHQGNLMENSEDSLCSPIHCLPELGVPLKQKVELKDDQLDVESHHGGEARSHSNFQLKQMQSPTHLDHERCFEASEISHAYPPRPPSVSEFFPQSGSHKLDVSEQAPDPLRSSFPAFGLLPEPFQLEQMQSPTHLDHERCFEASETSHAIPPRPPSVSEFFPQSGSHRLDVSEQAPDPLRSSFPAFGLLPEPTHISWEEMPPLPPLPPMQWRLGKTQHTSLSSQRDLGQHNLDHFHGKANLGFTAPEGEISQPPNVFLPHSTVKDNQHVHENLAGTIVHSSPLPSQLSTMVDHRIGDHDFLTSGRSQSTNPYLPQPAVDIERSENSFQAAEGRTEQPSLNPFSTVTDFEVPTSTYASRSSEETVIQPPPQLSPERTLERGILLTSTTLEEKVVNSPDTNLPPPRVKDEQPQQVFPILEGETAWSSSTSTPLPDFEDGNANGIRPMKLPRPRNPLIDAVVAHDKSKLRKVTDRVQPQIGQKVDERDSLLQQIRTKSFNLKPAVVTRPSIQGPNTNLKVAAILEKANAIRQALAGSDEDDDPDSWSDS